MVIVVMSDAVKIFLGWRRMIQLYPIVWEDDMSRKAGRIISENVQVGGTSCGQCKNIIINYICMNLPMFPNLLPA